MELVCQSVCTVFGLAIRFRSSRAGVKRVGFEIFFNASGMRVGVLESQIQRGQDPAQLPNATLLRGDRLFVFLCTLPRLAQWR